MDAQGYGSWNYAGYCTTGMTANMHIDSKDLVPVSIWEVRTPHMYMGSSRKHMGGVDTP